MADPFTISIYVPDGDPEGLRLVNRTNWTGLGLVFRRSDWPGVCNRDEMRRAGVYILVGDGDEDDNRPTLYIGQTDRIDRRIDRHHRSRSKKFWNRAVAFVSNVSTDGGLNRAHVTWLEHKLVKRAEETGRCRLANGSAPREGALSEAEKAGTQGFLKGILQILPLVGVREFEFPNRSRSRVPALPEPARRQAAGNATQEWSHPRRRNAAAPPA